MLATYDYWGYYNVCFLGGEIRHPQRNIPRAVLLSIGCVAALYLAMNLSVLGVAPWQQIASGGNSNLSTSVIAVFIARLYGSTAGRWMAVLILWTAFASIFSLLLGYSRVFYAAAMDGNFFCALCAAASALSHSACGSDLAGCGGNAGLLLPLD